MNFPKIAAVCAHWMGTPIAFFLSLGATILWACCGPVFGYSDTWQLVINTGTTVLTFHAVFLIQNEQNRQGAAIQAKLDELLRVNEKARDDLIRIEEQTEDAIEEARCDQHEP